MGVITRLSLVATVLCFAGAPSSVEADDTPAHIAIVLDDSGSMSVPDDGADAKGIAAFAASQVFRIVPEGARLALFTYASIAERPGSPLYYYENEGMKAASRFSAKIATGRITEKAKKQHPYNYGNTPCNTALNAGLDWLKRQRTEQPKGRSTLFFLTDGGCTPRAKEDVAPSTAKRLSSIDLFCVDFSKSAPGGRSKLSPGLRRACRKVVDVPSGKQLASLNVLQGFGNVMDVFEARYQSTRLMGHGVQAVQNADQSLGQAGKIDVFTTVACANDTCADDPLLQQIPAAVGETGRLEKGEWIWWLRHPKRRYARHKEIHPFQWMYLRLSPAEFAQMQDALGAEGRQTMIRPEWDVGVKLTTHRGKCEANAPVFSNARSATREVCVRATLTARTDANQRESATFDTFHTAYLGSPQGERYPQKLAATFASELKLEGQSKRGEPHNAAPASDARFPTWQETVELPVCPDVEAREGMDKGKLTVKFELSNRKLEPVRTISRQVRTLCFAPGDADQDGSKDAPYGPDCDPTNPQVNPNMKELCDDSIDNDCDSEIEPAMEREHTATCPPGSIREGKTYKVYVSSAESNGINEGCKNSDVNEIADQDPRSNDDDMDGCPDSADPDNDFCNPTSDVNCPNKCDWKLANAGQCRLDENGHVAVDLGQIDNRKTEVVCRMDVDALQFDCPELEGRKEFTAVFVPDPPRTVGDDCITLHADPKGYRIQQGKETEIRLEVRRTARCGNVSPVSDEAKRLRVSRALGGSLKVKPDNRKGLSGQFITRRFKVSAFYPQSIDFKAKGELTSGIEDDAPVRLEVTPTLGSFERRFVKPRDVFQTRELETVLTPFLKPKFALHTPEGQMERNRQRDQGTILGLSYFDCMSKTGRPEPIGAIETVAYDAAASSGAICIGLNAEDLSICPGGTLFTPCDETPEGTSAKVNLVHFGLGQTGQLLTPTAVIDQEQVISVRIERGFGAWFSPAPRKDGGGPGWWWIVIFINAFVAFGCWKTYSNCFESRRAIKPAVGWFVTIWLGVAFVIWNYGVLS